MYEHSYYLDYGAQAAGYVDAFMAAINWLHVARLFADLPTKGAYDGTGPSQGRPRVGVAGK